MQLKAINIQSFPVPSLQGMLLGIVSFHEVRQLVIHERVERLIRLDRQLFPATQEFIRLLGSNLGLPNSGRKNEPDNEQALD